MILSEPVMTVSHNVLASTPAISLGLREGTRAVLIKNLGGVVAYARSLQLGGTAAAAAGSIYIPGVVGAEIPLYVGAGEAISFFCATSTLLEVTEVS